MNEENRYKRLTEAYKVIIDVLREGTNNESAKANFEGSEDRCARAMIETCKTDKQIAEEIGHIINKSFPTSTTSEVNVMKNDHLGIICQGPITVTSSCPHHLYPVRYRCYVAYIPKDGRVLGLSKLARISKELGKRPILQEQLASDIADCLCAPMKEVIDENEQKTLVPIDTTFPCLPSEGSAVLLVGIHGCMCQRGVNEFARTSICELRGVFMKEGMEQKFYSLIKSFKEEI